MQMSRNYVQENSSSNTEAVSVDIFTKLLVFKDNDRTQWTGPICGTGLVRIKKILIASGLFSPIPSYENMPELSLILMSETFNFQF